MRQATRRAAARWQLLRLSAARYRERGINRAGGEHDAVIRQDQSQDGVLRRVGLTTSAKESQAAGDADGVDG
jgi:hypothetical protein